MATDITSSIAMNKRTEGPVVIVAQTPYQLLSAIMVRQNIDDGCHLWLVDPTLTQYGRACEATGLWDTVNCVDLNARFVGKTGWRNRVANVFQLRRNRKRVKAFIGQVSPTRVLIFADNHEIPAMIARMAKERANAKVVMMEEGTTVYFSYKRASVPYWKALLRKMLGFENSAAYSIGWSPHIDTLLLTHPKLAHKDYIQNRAVVPMPKGPYPAEAMLEFSRLVNVSFENLVDAEIEVVVIGQPLVECGLVSAEEEVSFLEGLNKSPFADKILIKAHPFEHRSKYDAYENLRVCDDAFSGIPAEVLLDAIKPVLVVSAFSSVSMNYCLRYGVKGIVLDLAGFPKYLKTFMANELRDFSLLTLVSEINGLAPLVEKLLREKVSDQSEYIADDLNWKRSLSSAFVR